MKNPSPLWELLLFLLLLSYASTAAAQSPGMFTLTGSMTTPRSGHTATLLLNGKVLITGGRADGRFSAELYDPATDTFTATADMTMARNGHTATLLPDGKVLITGGAYGSHPGTPIVFPDGRVFTPMIVDPLPNTELFDPSTGTFKPTGDMVVAPRYGHTATLLNNGKVLIAGGGKECPNGNDGCAIVDNPQLYDPMTGAFTLAGDYADKNGDPWFGTRGLVGAPTTLLPDGKVLIAAEPTAELYDPGTGNFSVTGQMTRATHAPWSGPGQPGFGIGGTATLLTNGKMLLAGGEIFETGWLVDAELYDPPSGKFTPIQNMTGDRSGHTATLLRDGTVLIAGGDHTCTFRNPGGVDVLRCDAAAIGTEIYDPATDTFKAGGNMTSYRMNHTATLLMDGRVLIVGGATDMRGFWPTDSAELYTPSPLMPAQTVTDLRFDRTNAIAGSSYSLNISGSNLTPETFFDIRFTSPGSTASTAVLNWQKGLAASHDVPIGTAAGNWTINGVRAHQVEADHSSSFVPVSATITVP